MPRRAVPLIAGHYYHIYNRGNNRAPIFFSNANYVYFLRQLREYVADEAAGIIAYVLMPNHYHLLIHANTDDVSHGMQLFTISYTKAINKAENRVGALFQGAFKSIVIDRNEYLLHLSRYIHLNPVLAGLVANAQDWRYSSYSDYIGLRQGTLPKPSVVLSQFEVTARNTSEVSETSEVSAAARAAYRAFVEAYLPADLERIKPFLLD